MMPLEVRQWIGWDQTKSDQGPWPRKIMVSLWFKHERPLILIDRDPENNERRDDQNEVLCKLGACKDKSGNKSPKENLATGSCDVLEAKGDGSKIKTNCGALQISFFAEVGPQGQRQLAAKYTREGGGHANEGRQIHPEVVSQVFYTF